MALSNSQLNKLDGISKLYTDSEISSREYLGHYLALVTQEGVGAPMEVSDKININTMGATWVYNSTGQYSLFALGAFPLDVKVDINISQNGWQSPIVYIKAARVNDANIDFEVGLNDAYRDSPTQTPTDNVLLNQRIEVIVYK